MTSLIAAMGTKEGAAKAREIKAKASRKRQAARQALLSWEPSTADMSDDLCCHRMPESECPSVRMPKCLNVYMHESPNAQMSKCTNVQVSANASESDCLNVQMPKCIITAQMTQMAKGRRREADRKKKNAIYKRVSRKRQAQLLK